MVPLGVVVGVSKISYLGQKNSTLPKQMAEQLAVEVDVKNVTQ